MAETTVFGAFDPGRLPVWAPASGQLADTDPRFADTDPQPGKGRRANGSALQSSEPVSSFPLTSLSCGIGLSCAHRDFVEETGQIAE
jgi:hypothetical protein